MILESVIRKSKMPVKEIKHNINQGKELNYEIKIEGLDINMFEMGTENGK